MITINAIKKKEENNEEEKSWDAIRNKSEEYPTEWNNLLEYLLGWNDGAACVEPIKFNIIA